ncbi:MAG: hypothetical protein H0U34_06700 [Sphingomonas sp.]|nr:hypothetical protein [Sphingomonas sp.]
MRFRKLHRAAVAAAAAGLMFAAARAQAPGADYSHVGATPGSWAYVTVSGGSEARFVDATGTIRLAVGCVRAARQVTIARISQSPAAALFVWTTGGSRNLPARFDQNSYRVSAQVGAFDRLLDEIAFSRGKVAVAMAGAPPLVVTSSPEPGRVFEDCRA